MNMDEEDYNPFGGYSSGCELHGEDSLRECTLCGIEFCAACFPQSTLCSDCAAQGGLDADDEDVEPTDEEKELLLLDGFNDDEPDAAQEEILPVPPSANQAKSAPKKGKKEKRAKPAPQKIRKKALPALKTKAKPSKPAPSKAKAKAQSQKTKASPKVKAKPKAKPKAHAKKKR